MRPEVSGRTSLGSVCGLSWTLPGLLLTVAALHCAAGLSLWLRWQFTGRSSPLFAFLDTAGNLFLLAFAVLETLLAITAWRRSSVDQPLFLAWGLISLAGAGRVAGVFVAHVLPSNWMRRLGVSGFDPKLLQEGGLYIAGPATYFLLLLALAVVLNVYRGLGWSARLKRRDYAAFAVFAVYTARHLYEAGVLHRRPSSTFALLNWASDPLLLLLFVEAVLLLRCAQRMGGGLVAHCWACYSAAIAMTLAGDVGLWASYWYFIPWPLSSLTWFIWFPASTAYALAPAYQFEAQRQFALFPAVQTGGKSALR